MIAIERGDERVRALARLATAHGTPVYVPAPVVAEVWRAGSARQARLAAFLRTGQERHEIHVPVLNFEVATQIGSLFARTGAAGVSVTDAMVAWCVLRYGGIACTSDPGDIGRLLPPERIRVV